MDIQPSLLLLAKQTDGLALDGEASAFFRAAHYSPPKGLSTNRNGALPYRQVHVAHGKFRCGSGLESALETALWQSVAARGARYAGGGRRRCSTASAGRCATDMTCCAWRIKSGPVAVFPRRRDIAREWPIYDYIPSERPSVWLALPRDRQA